MGVVRSILAVIAGFVLMRALVLGATYALQAIKPEWFLIGTPESSGYYALNIAYNLLAAMAGGYVAAKLASRAPLKHAYALAVLSVVMAISTALVSEQEQPRWYRVFQVLIVPATIVVGGRLVSAESQQHVAGYTAPSRIT